MEDIAFLPERYRKDRFKVQGKRYKVKKQKDKT